MQPPAPGRGMGAGRQLRCCNWGMSWVPKKPGGQGAARGGFPEASLKGLPIQLRLFLQHLGSASLHAPPTPLCTLTLRGQRTSAPCTPPHTGWQLACSPQAGAPQATGACTQELCGCPPKQPRAHREDGPPTPNRRRLLSCPSGLSGPDGTTAPDAPHLLTLTPPSCF